MEHSIYSPNESVEICTGSFSAVADTSSRRTVSFIDPVAKRSPVMSDSSRVPNIFLDLGTQCNPLRSRSDLEILSNEKTKNLTILGPKMLLL